MSLFAVDAIDDYGNHEYYLSHDENLWDWIHLDRSDPFRNEIMELEAPMGYVFRGNILFGKDEPVSNFFSTAPVQDSIRIRKDLPDDSLVHVLMTAMTEVGLDEYEQASVPEDRVITSSQY